MENALRERLLLSRGLPVLPVHETVHDVPCSGTVTIWVVLVLHHDVAVAVVVPAKGLLRDLAGSPRWETGPKSWMVTVVITKPWRRMLSVPPHPNSAVPRWLWLWL